MQKKAKECSFNGTRMPRRAQPSLNLNPIPPSLNPKPYTSYTVLASDWRQGDAARLTAGGALRALGAALGRGVNAALRLEASGLRVGRLPERLLVKNLADLDERERRVGRLHEEPLQDDLVPGALLERNEPRVARVDGQRVVDVETHLLREACVGERLA